MAFPIITYQQDPAQYVNNRATSMIASSYTAVGNTADTNEDILQTFTMPAALLISPSFPGVPAAPFNPGNPPKLLRIRAWGITANNADTKTLRVYHGTTVFSQALTASTANAWFAEMELAAKTPTTQVARFLVTHGAAVLGTQTLTTGTDKLTTALIVKVTGQASAANASDIVCQGAYVEVVQ